MDQSRQINIPLLTQRAVSPFLSSVMRNIQMKSAGWLETTVPPFNLKVTKKQLKRKLEECGPKKPAAVSTLQPFRGAFVFVHEQANK